MSLACTPTEPATTVISFWVRVPVLKLRVLVIVSHNPRTWANRFSSVKAREELGLRSTLPSMCRLTWSSRGVSNPNQRTSMSAHVPPESGLQLPRASAASGSFVQCRVCERARVCRGDGVQGRQGCTRGEEAANSSDTSSNVLVSEARSSHFVVGVPIESDGKYIVRTWIKDG